MNKKNEKMNTKRILVSFLVIASVLFLASAVSAASLASSTGTESGAIKVNDVSVGSYGGTPITWTDGDTVGVNAGDTITVKVQFTADNGTATWTSASDVRVKVTLEGEKDDVTAVTSLFDVISGRTYAKTLTLKVPSDFQDDNLNENLNMDVKIWNSDEVDAEITGIKLELQRHSYDVAIKSVMTSDTVEAGQLLLVDVVLKNIGFNDLEDLYVTASIDSLKLSKTAFFGDLVNVASEEDDNNENTVSGRLYLEIPYTVKSGTYTLTVSAENEDTTSVVTKDLVINNGFPDLAMKSENDLILLNPTNQLKVYKVVYGTTQLNVIVPAASSKNVAINVPTSGDYNFDVLVYSGDTLLSTVNFSGSGQAASQLTNPVLVLTVILAIVFLVLLVVLVVLITRKPQKTEEFGESYY
jgi:hypothetical protein